MVTRSIFGRFLILAVLVVSMGVMAQAALIITRGPVKKDSGKEADAANPGLVREAEVARPAPAQQPEAAPIRVVYPGPLGDDTAPARKVANAAPASPLSSLPSPALESVGTITQDSADQAGPDLLAAPAESTAPAPAAVAPEPAASAPSSLAVASVDPAPVQQNQDGSSSAKSGVNINSASAEALNHLQGGGRIGQTIVQHRPYKSVDELLKKRVIRRAVYDQIKNQIAAQ